MSGILTGLPFFWPDNAAGGHFFLAGGHVFLSGGHFFLCGGHFSPSDGHIFLAGGHFSCPASIFFLSGSHFMQNVRIFANNALFLVKKPQKCSFYARSKKPLEVLVLCLFGASLDGGGQQTVQAQETEGIFLARAGCDPSKKITPYLCFPALSFFAHTQLFPQKCHPASTFNPKTSCFVEFLHLFHTHT
jgi:hypothetical protein